MVDFPFPLKFLNFCRNPGSCVVSNPRGHCGGAERRARDQRSFGGSVGVRSMANFPIGKVVISLGKLPFSLEKNAKMQFLMNIVVFKLVKIGNCP